MRPQTTISITDTPDGGFVVDIVGEHLFPDGRREIGPWETWTLRLRGAKATDNEKPAEEGSAPWPSTD